LPALLLSRRKVAMPVYVESVTQPSPQDLTDLAKIYADAPEWLLTPYASAEALIAAALADGSLIAGRFNDRLLGAALLQRSDDAWRLSHLCVRKLTRKRGVGRRLLEETQRQASEAGRPLRLAAPAGHLEASALAARTHLPLDPL
jgi:GNAT superfamily N-acetyltransferase